MKFFAANGKTRSFVRRNIVVLFLCLAAFVSVVAWALPAIDNYIYGCDVTADYHFNFSPESGRLQRFNSRILRDRFIVPQNTGSWDTGFLKIRLVSTLLGRIVEPYLEIEICGKSYRQYFMRGTEGTRYINISPLSGQHVGQVIIRGHHLTWDAQDGELLLFSNRFASAARILVISPHPDDAELAAFGLYSHRDSYVVTVTDGGVSRKDYGSLFPVTDMRQSNAIKSKLRVIDSLTVPYIGDISPERCINLGFHDGTLKEMYRFPSREVSGKYFGSAHVSTVRAYNLYPLPPLPAEATWSNLVKSISAVLDKIHPDIIVAPHPLLDSHPDHYLSSIALFEAMRKYGNGVTSTLYLYTNHRADFYPYGTCTSSVSLPPYFQDNRVFDSVYSYTLSDEQTIEKRFAIHAMHDIGPPPPKPDPGVLDLLKNVVNEVGSFVKYHAHLSESYYRRALRPNELFFVYPSRDAGRLLREFEKSQKVAGDNPDYGGRATAAGTQPGH